LVEIAKVICADVAVIATQRRARNAHSVLTDVVLRTDAAVVTRLLIGDELTASGRSTRIVSANIVVSARQSARTDTCPQGAMVTDGTNVRIVTWGAVE
jgi:hypothetical protein